jgi:hypothetical protein
MTYYFLAACAIVVVTFIAGLILHRGSPEVP